MLDRSAVALLPSSQRFAATGLDALLSQTAKIDTSPFILSPFEAERTSADQAFIRLHVIPVFTPAVAMLPPSSAFASYGATGLISARQVGATSPPPLHFGATRRRIATMSLPRETTVTCRQCGVEQLEARLRAA
jgi:hypothetical protein